MDRTITGYHRDEDADWVADLDCGHPQHVRHRPPFEDRAWTQTDAGRESRLGTVLNCVRCDAREWPTAVAPYKSTPVFDQDTVPKGLLRQHRTKAGVWARIEVLDGALHYRVHAPFNDAQLLTPEAAGVVLPQVPHEVEPAGDVRFRVVFHRRSKPEEAP